MLSYMVQALLENMEVLDLPELTHALKTCFKVLSKVQMPPSYLDIETGSGNGVGIFQLLMFKLVSYILILLT